MSDDKNAQVQPSLFGDVPVGTAASEAAAPEPVPGPSAAPKPATPRARAAELNRILSHAAYAYYALDDPEMTDAAFDRLLQELLALEDRKSTRLNSSHDQRSRMPSSA